jgi:hypothetical protein
MNLRQIFSLKPSQAFSEKRSFFRLQKIGWKLLGFWIGSDEVNYLRLALVILNCTEIIGYGVFQCYFVYENRGNFVTFLDGLTPFLTQTPMAMRVLFLLWHRRTFKKMLDFLEGIFDNCTKEEHEINDFASKKTTMLLAAAWILAAMTDLSYIVVPIVKNIYSLIYFGSRSFDLPFKAS